MTRSRARPVRPIAIVGFMGAGKSAVAFAVGAVLGRAVVDLDRVVEHEANSSIADIFESEGEAGFRRREAAALNEQLEGQVVVALGGGALDDPNSLRLVRSRACVAWLDVPLDVLWLRAGNDPNRPLARDRSSFDQLFASRRDRYAACGHRLDGTRPVLELAEEIAELCGGSR